MYIYSDNAAQKPLTNAVIQTIKNFSDSDFCNPSAIYNQARKTKQALEQARKQVAECIGADADEIFFTSGSTEAINWVASLSGNIILMPPIEHKALLKAFQSYTQRSVIMLPVNSGGLVDTNFIEETCKKFKQDCMVSMGWINNEIGVIQPVGEVASICKRTGAKLFLDATQAIGKIQIDVHNLNVDYLCGSFHKLGALAGSGFLYVKKGAKLKPFIYGGSQEHGMRAGTENLLGALCGAVAIKEAVKDLDIKMLKCLVIQDKIIKQLCKLPKTHLNGSWGNRVETNVNICFEGVDAETLVLMLNTDGICVSSGSACNSESIEPSHVLKAIGLSDDDARSSIRITFEDTTEEEVDYLIERITARVEELRR